MSLIPCLLHSAGSAWAQLWAGPERNDARREKLQRIFREGQYVRSLRTGRVYSVEAAEVCFAILKDERGIVVVDWLHPSGALKLTVADDWEPASRPPVSGG